MKTAEENRGDAGLMQSPRKARCGAPDYLIPSCIQPREPKRESTTLHPFRDYLIQGYGAAAAPATWAAGGGDNPSTADLQSSPSSCPITRTQRLAESGMTATHAHRLR